MKLNKTFIILIILFFCAFFPRTYLIQQNLFFGPEQGIDFMVIRQIAVDHKLTLIGAKTDVSGVFHGPIYYYLATIPFIISQGDPVFISFFFILLNCLNVFFIYYLGKIIGNKRIGIIAAILFVVSFQAIIYPRWLSSHPLAIPLSTMFFLFFYRFIKGSKKDLLFAVITLGLLNQAEFLHIIFFAGIGFILFIIYFKNFKKVEFVYLLFCVIVAFILTAGTYILFDLKHQFLISKNLLSLVNGNTGYHISIIQTITQTWDSVVRVFTRTIFPTSIFGALILFLSGITVLINKIVKKENNFIPLLIWLIIPFVILIILRHNILDQFFVSQISLFILITAILIDSIWKKKKIIGIIALIIICFVNILVWWENIPVNREIFFQSTQPELRYSDQLSTIDEIYKRADNKDFSFQSYTIPYWTQDGWIYLFKTYGVNAYGYAPIEQKAKKLFVIIQDDPGNSVFQRDWLEKTVSTWGKPVGKFRHGSLTTLELKTEAK